MFKHKLHYTVRVMSGHQKKKKISILPIKKSKDNLIKQLAKCITHYLHIGTVCTQGVKGSSPHYVVLLLLGYLGLAHILYATTILLFWNQKEVLVLT